MASSTMDSPAGALFAQPPAVAVAGQIRPPGPRSGHEQPPPRVFAAKSAQYEFAVAVKVGVEVAVVA